MDWPAIASGLGEWAELPVAVLDRDGHLCLMNRAMEQVVGWSRSELLGRHWSSLESTSRAAAAGRSWIDDGLEGTLQRVDMDISMKSGARVALELELFAIGAGNDRALLVGVRRSSTSADSSEPASWSEVDYEISLAGDDFGYVRRMYADGRPVHLAHSDVRCFVLLHGRRDRCPDCPVQRRTHQEASVLVRRDDYASEGDRFRIVTSEIPNEFTARIRVRTVSQNVVAAIREIKLDRLCEKAGLSSREREVLSQLVRGHSVDEIATSMGIRARTVKYHQSNVLHKVGADSRAQLMLLLQ